jgi:serine-type D-Ala-D-Ala carboxypeptidase (penicillin-binding protein 5/6)
MISWRESSTAAMPEPASSPTEAAAAPSASRRMALARLAAAVGLAFAIAVSPAAAAAKGPPAKAAAPKAAPSTAEPAPAESTIGIDTQAKHAIVLGAESGTVLLEKAADERFPPASMSKMMTAYLVFSYLKDGRAKLTDQLPISERAWRTGGSKMFVPLGGRVSIEDLVRGMIVESGNDACVALAEGLAGSVEAFVQQMNEKAKQIGLTNSHFANVDGLPDPEHYMTARDLATLAMRTIKDFPEYYKYYSEREFTFNNIKQGNRNPLLYKNIGADGLKTGHTEESGYSLTASVIRNGRRIVMVLQDLPNAKARDQESERLAEWAFREFTDYKLVAAGDKVDDAPVWLGAEASVPLTVARDFVVTLSHKSRSEMKVSEQYDGPVAAPIRKGQPVGKIVVTAPGAQPTEAPLVAGADVPRMGALGRVAALAGYLVWGERH